MQLLQKECEGVGDNYQLFNAYSILADIYLKLNKYKEAQDYGEKALKFYEANGSYSEIMDLYFVIAKASASLKQYDKAFNNLMLFKQNNDSVFKFSKIEAVNSVEAKYKTEKKEQQIAGLNIEKKNQRIITGISIAALLATLTLLVFLLRSKKLQKRLFEKEKLLQKNESEKQLANLEQTALRAQMNPHFIFNSLNSVQRFVINNDSEGVNTYLTTFASLIRQTLENSGKKLIALKDELKYLEAYLKLEQMRANNSFGYSIDVSSEIDVSETYIPSMIIQPFVENSINHGMANKAPGQGDIKLSFSKNGKLNCSVLDNGTGIKQSVANTAPGSHEPMGSTITQKRIFAYNTLEDEKIELSVTDLSEADKNNNGTVVIIKFPLKTIPQ